MDPSKVILTKEDIRERLGLLQRVIEGRQARVRDALDAVTNAVLEGTLESARSLAKGLHDEETALDRVVQQRTRLEAALVTAADDPGETSGLEGHVMGHIEDQEGMPRAAGGEPHDALDPAGTRSEGSGSDQGAAGAEAAAPETPEGGKGPIATLHEYTSRAAPGTSMSPCDGHSHLVDTPKGQGHTQVGSLGAATTPYITITPSPMPRGSTSTKELRMSSMLREWRSGDTGLAPDVVHPAGGGCDDP